MKVIDYEETMKCLDEVEDCEDKTYAKSLLEWAINKRTFEAVPLSVKEALEKEADSLSQAYKEEHEKLKSLMLAIEKIKAEIIQYFMQNKDSEDLFLAGCGDGAYHALAIIDKAVKECTHE